jgi:hypothetical protein
VLLLDRHDARLASIVPDVIGPSRCRWGPCTNGLEPAASEIFGGDAGR